MTQFRRTDRPEAVVCAGERVSVVATSGAGSGRRKCQPPQRKRRRPRRRLLSVSRPAQVRVGVWVEVRRPPGDLLLLLVQPAAAAAVAQADPTVTRRLVELVLKVTGAETAAVELKVARLRVTRLDDGARR